MDDASPGVLVAAVKGGHASRVSSIIQQVGAKVGFE